MNRNRITDKTKSALKTLNGVAFLRVTFIVFALLMQLGIIIGALHFLDEYFVWFYFVSSLLGFLLSLGIVSNRSNPGYKIAWIILILILPIFGAMIYLLFGSGHMSKKTKHRLRKAEEQVRSALKNGPTDEMISHVKDKSLSAANQMTYLYKAAGCPVYTDTYIDLLTPGEVKFERMKKELQKAEKFIFLEYFIISNGQMWDEILEILMEKAQAGVEVRVMYDDLGSLLTLPNHYDRFLSERGIKSCVFGKLIPVLSVLLNHRDHRKILVIDGKVGFTGGINIADEYINVKKKHGHWEDKAIFIEGAAVWSLTVFFLSTWGYVTGENEDFAKYRVDGYRAQGGGGIVQPYYDSPLDKEQVCENVYLNMISRATKYVYIETPYLIITNEMITALCNAAKQGVDVRIITPHIGDRWYVHAMTRSNYERLTESGVRIYEYTPGFIHAKLFVCDDELAIVGTVNMDYRSLYLHFENAVLMYDIPVIHGIYEDFMRLVGICHEVTYEECRQTELHRRMARAIFKVFAPLM